MIRSCRCLVFAAVLQVVLGQGLSGTDSGPPGFQRPQSYVPKHCFAPPPGVDLHTCCPIPQLFPDEDMESCGIQKLTKEQYDNPSPARVPCKESFCLLRNANLLKANNNSIDYEKMEDFVDSWAKMDPDFTMPITNAKKVCLIEGGPPSPPVCEPDRVFTCLTSYVLWNCKLKLEKGEGCKILKEHMDGCRPFLAGP